MTGQISFNATDGRTFFKLEIVELTKEGFRKIGTWDPLSKVNYSRTMKEIYSQMVEKLENKTFIVVSRLVSRFFLTPPPPSETLFLRRKTELGVNFKKFLFQGPPFLMLKEPQSGLTGNDRFEGYSINLIDEIAKELNFKYEFTLAPDGKYGSYNKVTKKWDGLIKQLLDRVSLSFYKKKKKFQLNSRKPKP